MPIPIDPFVIVDLIAAVIKILIKLLGSPEAVQKYLSGRDLWIWQRPFVMPRRMRNLRDLARRQADHRVMGANNQAAATDQAVDKMLGMTAWEIMDAAGTTVDE